jgi:TetR/AcrR family transcriptional repressor of nem operon
MPQRNLREQILVGGGRAIYEKGFHAASVSDIAVAASVPKGSVYNHFESKQALALEALNRYAAEFGLESLDGFTGSPLAALRDFFARSVQTTVDRGVELGCLLGNLSVEMAGHGGPLAEAATHFLALWSTRTAQVLRAAQAAGELDDQLDADALGAYIVDAYEGAVARAKLQRDRGPLDAFMQFTFDGPFARLTAGQHLPNAAAAAAADRR